MFRQELIRFLVNRRIRRVANSFNTKIRKIHNGSCRVPKAIARTHLAQWEMLADFPINLGWLAWYTDSSRLISSSYVPESVYYTIIEPILNDYEVGAAWDDKNIYDLLYPRGLFPSVVLRNIDGDFLDGNYNPVEIRTEPQLVSYLDGKAQVIIKPSFDSGGGQKILLFIESKDGFVDHANSRLTLDLLKSTFGSNYLIQERMTQHEFLARFNASSVNTIRVFTYRSVTSGKIAILHTILRVGAPGQWVDNSRAGGFAIGVDSLGHLNDFATLRDGSNHSSVNGVCLSRGSERIPCFDKVCDVAVRIAKKNIYHRLLGLDMMVDEKGTVHCIEVNNRSNEINFYQLNIGPLFGDYSAEVIDFCHRNLDKLYRSYRL